MLEVGGLQYFVLNGFEGAHQVDARMNGRAGNTTAASISTFVGLLDGRRHLLDSRFRVIIYSLLRH